MVVRRRHRHHLLGADRGADRGEPGRVADRAGGDDRPLALHQPRHRRDRADPAGVGERDVGALQVVGGQPVLARLGDQLAERVEEAGEREPAGVADDRDHQRPAAVLALDVDGDAEVAGAVVDDVRLAVDRLEVARHHRHLLGRGARDRVGDQVGERDLVAGLLEQPAPRVERRDGDGAERRRGRHLARLVHVAREHRRGALDELGAGGRGRGRGRGDRPVGAAVDRREHVVLADPAGRAAAVHARDVDPVHGGDAPGDGGDPGSLGNLDRRDAGRSRRARRGGRRRLGALGSGSRGHPADHLSDRDRVAGLREDLGDGAGRGRGHLGVDLVGRDLDDRLVRLDRVADLLGPLEHDALGDRLAHRRHHDVDGLLLLRCLLLLRGLLRLRGLLLLRRRRLRRRGGRSVRRRDLGQQGADPDCVALGRVDLHHRSVDGCRDLGVDLVGRYLDERLVGCNGVPLRLVPFQHGALAHRVTHCRHDDFHRRRVDRHWNRVRPYRVTGDCRRRSSITKPPLPANGPTPPTTATITPSQSGSTRRRTA